MPGAPDADLGDPDRDEGGRVARRRQKHDAVVRTAALVGIASAAILLDEPIDLSLAIAAGLIVADIGLATLGDRLPPRQAAASG